MTRVAAIDCGTNSVRLLIADHDGAAGALVDHSRRNQIVRLGQDVDRTGRLAPEALERTFAALRGYAEEMDRAGVARLRMVATSAARDAENRAEFTAGVQSVLGVAPEILDGSAEAALSFAGATRELTGGGPAGAADPAARPPYLVVDIGGGSTEFVLGTTAPTAACSVDIGCVRLTERHLHDDPPSAGQIRSAVADIDAALARAAAAVPVRQARTVVGLAGSVTTVAALALGLPAYDAYRIHHAWVGAESVRSTAADLLASTRDRRAALGVVHPGRVDVIGAGALILSRVLRCWSLPAVLASEHDILDGIAWSLLDRG